VKIFSQNGPCMGKNMWEIRIFDIFEAKKHFPDSGKACVLSEKSKNRIFATFRFNTQAFPESRKCFFASKILNFFRKDNYVQCIKIFGSKKT
jgi:hypothetical protein